MTFLPSIIDSYRKDATALHAAPEAGLSRQYITASLATVFTPLPAPDPDDGSGLMSRVTPESIRASQAELPPIGTVITELRRQDP
jgi:hypothetical protein